MQIVTNTTASTALAAAATKLASVAAQGGPNAIAIGIIPEYTALAAAETVTATITRDDTGAVIGQSILTNPGAGASTGGPQIVCAPIPAGIAGSISLNVTGSVATGAVAASATMPIVLFTLP